MSKSRESNRFGFIHPDKCVAKSQCVECAYNQGKTCKKFGLKPMEYARAVSDKVCLKRKRA